VERRQGDGEACGEAGPANTPDEQFDLMLMGEMTAEQLIAVAPTTPALQDERPINEYYFLARTT
jgi:hypothetical protein